MGSPSSTFPRTYVPLLLPNPGSEFHYQFTVDLHSDSKYTVKHQLWMPNLKHELTSQSDSGYLRDVQPVPRPLEAQTIRAFKSLLVLHHTRWVLLSDTRIAWYDRCHGSLAIRSLRITTERSRCTITKLAGLHSAAQSNRFQTHRIHPQTIRFMQGVKHQATPRQVYLAFRVTPVVRSSRFPKKLYAMDQPDARPHLSSSHQKNEARLQNVFWAQQWIKNSISRFLEIVASLHLFMKLFHTHAGKHTTKAAARYKLTALRSDPDKEAAFETCKTALAHQATLHHRHEIKSLCWFPDFL